MLKSMLKVKENVDISNYSKVHLYLKRKNEGYEPKKSKILSQDNVSKFLTEAPGDTFLLIKVALIFGLYGACRSEELRKLNVEDIEDTGSVLVVTLHDTKTKKKRIFTVTREIGGINEIELYRRYVSLRPKHINHSRFFIFYMNNKCTVQPVGIHSFYKMPKKIAHYLNLPNPDGYTGHCLRRTSTTFLAEGGADIRRLKSHGGWRSNTTAEGYIEESINNKKTTSKMIFNQPSSSDSGCQNPSDIVVKPNELHLAPACSDSSGVHQEVLSKSSLTCGDLQLQQCTSSISFSNLNNCTFNIYSNK